MAAFVQGLEASHIREHYNELHSNIKAGRFDKNKLQSQIGVLQPLLTDAVYESDPVVYLQGQCLIAEVYDYFGQYSDAEDALTLRDDIFQMLPANIAPEVDISERIKIRARIRYALHVIQTMYRSGKPDAHGKALSALRSCEELILEQLRTEHFPCYGTLGQISFYRGRVLRQMNQFDEAEEAFNEAISYYSRRAQRKLEEHKDDQQRAQEEVAFSQYKIAVCYGVGIGWISHIRGALRKARETLNVAKALLLNSGDELNRAYIDLLSGSVRRCLAGEDIGELEEARKTVERAYDTFHKNEHNAYSARCAYELALIALYKSDTVTARKHLGIMRTGIASDVRWQCSVDLLESRIHRKEAEKLRKDSSPQKQSYELAEACAERACMVAEKHNETLHHIDGLVALGEVHLSRGKDYELAISQFQKALTLSLNSGSRRDSAELNNPKMYAICHLKIAAAAARAEDFDMALAHHALWLRVKDSVEHRSIHVFAAELERELKDEGRPFYILPTEPDLNYETHKELLEEWLLTEAERRIKGTGTNQTVADLLILDPRTVDKIRNRREAHKKGQSGEDATAASSH